MTPNNRNPEPAEWPDDEQRRRLAEAYRLLVEWGAELTEGRTEKQSAGGGNPPADYGEGVYQCLSL